MTENPAIRSFLTDLKGSRPPMPEPARKKLEKTFQTYSGDGYHGYVVSGSTEAIAAVESVLDDDFRRRRREWSNRQFDVLRRRLRGDGFVEEWLRWRRVLTRVDEATTGLMREGPTPWEARLAGVVMALEEFDRAVRGWTACAEVLSWLEPDSRQETWRLVEALSYSVDLERPVLGTVRRGIPQLDEGVVSFLELEAQESVHRTTELGTAWSPDRARRRLIRAGIGCPRRRITRVLADVEQLRKL